MLNESFCELTAMYWAWKNVDSHYYGLFHYRRALNFNSKIKARKYFDVNQLKIAPRQVAKKLRLDRRTILTHLESAPMILAQPIIVPRAFAISHSLTQYEIYARDHRKQDLDIVLGLIRARYPHLVESMEKVFFTPGLPLSWCNVFIMRKDLYHEYCSFLFPVLLEARESIDTGGYNSYQKRVFGFIAERLLNVFVWYKMFSAGLMPVYKWLFELGTPRAFFGEEVIGDTKRIYAFGVRIHKAKIRE